MSWRQLHWKENRSDPQGAPGREAVLGGVPAVGVLAIGWAPNHVDFAAPVAIGGRMCLVIAAVIWRQRPRLFAAIEEN